MVSQQNGISCQSCGHADVTWQEWSNQLAIYRCSNCHSLSFLGPLPKMISEIYGEDYFNGREYKAYEKHRQIHDLNFKRKWRILKKFQKNPSRVFELGCAYGFFGDFVLRNGASNYFGIDVSEPAIEYASQNFGPHFGLNRGRANSNYSYNCLVAWDVWEHLERPLETFRDLVKDLEPGGFFAFTTVDSSAWVARMRGEKWRQIHPPTHIHYPNWHALKKMIPSLGLELIHQSYFGYHRALSTYTGALCKNSFIEKIPALASMPIYMNLRDTQLVIARKN
jgi:2-polyprenyl-3-methyl-5-hydroxy-6-metoxy-1,4-benzoquinol methylase